MTHTDKFQETETHVWFAHIWLNAEYILLIEQKSTSLIVFLANHCSIAETFYMETYTCEQF